MFVLLAGLGARKRAKLAGAAGRVSCPARRGADEILAAEEGLAAQAARLVAVPGVGALTAAALSAARANPILRTFYQRLRAAGKPAKLALTAVMRKLFLLLNHLLKNPSFQLAT